MIVDKEQAVDKEKKIRSVKFSEDKLNILILHRLGDPSKCREVLRNLELMLPQYAPGHNYIIHDVSFPLPKYVMDFNFHAIVMNTSFVSLRYDPERVKEFIKYYDFVRQSDAFKIAIVQDDYDYSAVLDNWMYAWYVDLIYSVCPDHHEILYPKFLSSKGEIRLAYTGYITPEMVDIWKKPKEFNKRNIDVSYRANEANKYIGLYGYDKAMIGELFTKAVSGHGLNLDISTKRNKILEGKDWYNFVEDSRFCLTTNSGMSLHDPWGQIRLRVKHYMAEHPKADFEEVEKQCYPGLDGKYLFSALSPRNFEACLSNTVQIALHGKYSGIMNPIDHYIPMQRDCSNIDEVLDMIKDYSYVKQVQRNAKENILGWDELRVENRANKIIESIKEGIQIKNVNSESIDNFDKCKNKYQDDVIQNQDLIWDIYRHLYEYGQASTRLEETIADNIDSYLDLCSVLDDENKKYCYSDVANVFLGIPDEIVRQAHLRGLHKTLTNNR